MSELTNNVKQYLVDSSDISNDEKKYTMNFCKKLEYLNGLRDVVVKELHTAVTVGYGSVNSKICLVFSNENSFLLLKPVIQEILEKFRLNLWDIYVTFVDKTPIEYANKYAYLVNELYAVGSQVVYIIDKDEAIFDNINKAFSVMNVPRPTDKMFFISAISLCSSEEEKKISSIFKYLINYRN